MKKVVVRWEEILPLFRYKIIVHFTPLNFYVRVDIESKDLDTLSNEELELQIKDIFYKELRSFIEGRVNMDNKETFQEARDRQLKEKIHLMYGIPVELVDVEEVKKAFNLKDSKNYENIIAEKDKVIRTYAFQGGFTYLNDDFKILTKQQLKAEINMLASYITDNKTNFNQSEIDTYKGKLEMLHQLYVKYF
jgi:hypothetical protein